MMPGDEGVSFSSVFTTITSSVTTPVDASAPAQGLLSP